MNISRTPLPGVVVIHTTARGDARGEFTRLFCAQELHDVMQKRHIVQINYSRTTQLGTIRGLHYQNQPFAEMKLIRCIRGAIWDVALDLRAGSPTFLSWHAAELTHTNGAILVVPEGCAHGFQALSDDSELLYLHTAPYTPSAEHGVAWNDPRIAIDWPLRVPARDGLSPRDRSLPPLSADFLGLRL